MKLPTTFKCYLSLFAITGVPQVIAQSSDSSIDETEIMTITQKLFALGMEFQPDMQALLDEKTPLIEKILESHIQMEKLPVAKKNIRLEEMAHAYTELSDSINLDEHGNTYKHVDVRDMDGVDFHDFVAEKMPMVEEALTEAVMSKETDPTVLQESALYSLLSPGGKRLRPMLCLAAFEMFAPVGTDSSVAVPTAISSELIHTMSLMTDDLPSLDDDNERRGIPSNHVVYGENVAMLAAGSLMAYSFSQILEETHDVDAAVLVQVSARLARVIGADGMAGGQMLDLMAENKTDSTLLDLEWIHLHKTASLIQYSVVSGAILAGASDEEIQAMEEYGNNIGLAFQVVDDILDIDEDATAGKLTYPKMLGVEGAKQEATKLIHNAKTAVAPFQDRAYVLNSFADFLTVRGGL